MSLLGLPNELLLIIAMESNNLQDIHSLLLTNRALSNLLPTTLYRIAARDQDRAMTALFYAAVNRNEGLIKTLLEKSHGIAVMNVQTGFVQRTLDKSTNGMVISVLSQGANLVLQPGPGQLQQHALHWAVWRMNESLTRLLLENGAVIDLEDASGRTALHEAVWRGDIKFVRLLLDHGADAAKRDPYDRSILDVASTYGHREVVMTILEKRPGFFKMGDNSTITLLHAALDGDEGLVRMLVVYGADPEARGTDGRTALHIAAKKGQVEIARILVENGAAIDQSDLIYQQTPLHIATKEGHEDIVRLLMQNGAECMLTDKGGQNATDLAKKYQKGLVPVLRSYAGSRIRSPCVQKPTLGSRSKRQKRI